MIFVTHIHLVGGERHEHISRVRWRNSDDGQHGESTREEMVEWIGEKRGEAWVTDGVRNVRVGVVRASPPYIRTYADGVWDRQPPCPPALLIRIRSADGRTS